MNRNIFQSASIQLTGLYLFIILTISVLFSSWLYNVSLREIEQSVYRIPGSIQRLLASNNPTLARELRASQEEAVAEARSKLISQLITINVIIAAGGGVLSYMFARKTLTPIEKAHEAQSRFTSDASHELRTPIAAMRLENEIALADPNLRIKDARTLLQSNIEELDKLTALSEGMLQLARYDGGQIERDTVAIEDIVHTALARVEKTAKTHKVRIETSRIPTKMIQVSKAAIVQALVVLLDNAIKYSPAEGIVHLTVKQQNSVMLLSVKDNGVGIRKEDMPHIFERFYQADTARSKHSADATDGYGIGLSIAKSAVETHGGKITVESAPGHGSTFTIRLPVHVR